MPSSPLSSNLSTPPKSEMKEPQIEDEMDEELEEEEEEQEEDEADDMEDEETEDRAHHEAKKEPDLAHSNQNPLENAPQVSSQRQRRTKRVHNQKVLGTTILPVTRVTRAAKQDKDIKIVSKEAVFLISIATEFFVKKLTDSAFERSKREKRVFVKYNDVAAAVKRNPEYDWLEEVIPESVTLGTILRNPTIPSSSTAVTNHLPTEALLNSNNSTLGPSKASLPDNTKLDHLNDKSTSIPALTSIDNDGMDVDDNDELDEEF